MMEERKRILYVDDERVNLKLFEISFRNDFDIITALSAERGMEILEEYPNIDVIISDLKMPEMNGLEFISRIKERKNNAICILLSGFVESELLMYEFDRDSVFRYLIKPWDKEELYATLVAALKKAKG